MLQSLYWQRRPFALTGAVPAMQIYMVQNNVQRWSSTWFWMQARPWRHAHGIALLPRRRLSPVATEVYVWGCTRADHQPDLPDCLHRRRRGLREGHHHRRGELRALPEHAGLGRAMRGRPGAPARVPASPAAPNSVNICEQRGAGGSLRCSLSGCLLLAVDCEWLRAWSWRGQHAGLRLQSAGPGVAACGRTCGGPVRWFVHQLL